MGKLNVTRDNSHSTSEGSYVAPRLEWAANVSKDRVNYDDIASTYDGRYRRGLGEGQHTIPAALSQLLTPDVPNHILEVGCGTGFWLGSFGDRHKVYGMDVSQGMLMK